MDHEAEGHEDEVLATLVAYDLISDTMQAVEWMLAYGPVPAEPKDQKRRLAQIEDVRKRLAEGKVRPWFTQTLTPAEQLARFLDPALRAQIEAVVDPETGADYYEHGTKLMERQG